LAQFDGSYHKRIPWVNEEFCLLLAVDDATSDIIWAKLCDNEWYENVVLFWVECIMRSGIPKWIYLDKFSTYKVNHPKATYDKTLKTNFDVACRELWCHLIFANSPQAKWRVERNNRTLQDRFYHDLQIQWIGTIEGANKYLQEVYIPRHNNRYGSVAKEEWDVHVQREGTREELEWVFARKQIRILQPDFVVQHKKKLYQLEDGQWLYSKQKITVREHYNGEIRLEVNWQILTYDVTRSDIIQAQRNRYRARRNKEQKKIDQVKMEELQKSRHEISKKRQAKHRAEKLTYFAKNMPKTDISI
jgi:hypothetical protein